MTEETIIFGAGCFWGVEAEFRRLKGVTDAVCGYCGGHVENPSYEMVCSGTTGHIEVVQVTFDTKIVSLDALLECFWQCHDPTSKDRQGADNGEQYRSVIFYCTDNQKVTAMKSMDNLQRSGRFNKAVVTQILPAKTFYKAEEYHQNYVEKHGYS